MTGPSTAAAWRHSWVAERPGRTRVTLTIRVNGDRIELGTVTVVVR